MNQAYALCSVILFAMLAALLFLAGNHFIKVCVVLSLLLGAVGQNLAQSDSTRIVEISIVLTYAAIFIASVSTLVFMAQ